MLIGASRERVGFDRTTSYEVLARLAAQAAALFPALAGVRVQRAYRGFRPYCPDHLPVIGPDQVAHGVRHHQPRISYALRQPVNIGHNRRRPRCGRRRRAFRLNAQFSNLPDTRGAV